MGISSNQARFLALTSRQVDLEFRVQQICQRRLRLASELENVATGYNNKISDRKLFTMNTSNGGVSALTATNITALKDMNGKSYTLLYDTTPAAATRAYATAVAAYTTDAAGILSIGGTATAYNIGIKSSTNESEILEAAIRSGAISIATSADEFTQTPAMLGAVPYEIKDWKTLPVIADELYKGDDVDAQNKYDKTIAEINAQDKKLQLEQTSIEVEYKAVTSEKESVKKILDTNAQASFKYFS